MKKRAFIVHGWGGKPNQHWLPWLALELEQQGFVVDTPAMPNTDEPILEEWVGHLAHVVGELDEQTYFVGHSIGCQTILRYLETQSGKKAGGCVFVAGWFKLANLENEEEERIAKPWLATPIDFERVLSVTDTFTVLLSSNEPYNAVEENEQLFKQHLTAAVTIMPNMGHFTADDGVTELPAARDAVLRYAHR